MSNSSSSSEKAKKIATSASVAAPLLVAAASSGAIAKKSDVLNVLTKADLVEAIQIALKDRRYVEEQSAVIAKENQEKAHFAALQKQTQLASRQSSLKFLQEQLKDTTVKIPAAKKKEMEAKVEELLATICTDIN